MIVLKNRRRKLISISSDPILTPRASTCRFPPPPILKIFPSTTYSRHGPTPTRHIWRSKTRRLPLACGRRESGVTIEKPVQTGWPGPKGAPRLPLLRSHITPFHKITNLPVRYKALTLSNHTQFYYSFQNPDSEREFWFSWAILF
jgi:hypothetical protein